MKLTKMRSGYTKPLLIGFGLYFCITILAAYFWSKPNIQIIETPTKDEGLLITNFLTPRTSEEDKLYLQTNSFWGSNQSEASETKSDQSAKSSWRLRGLLRESDTHYAIIEIKNLVTNKVIFEKFKVNDSLPNGEIIVSISTTNMAVEVNGKKTVYTLHKRPQ